VAYPRDEIDRVRERTDLAELASEITKVKRSGRSVMAVCPFHQEKTPSLSIDATRGLYHCFGCGKSGDVFRWVQETNGLDFREAVEFLARRAGVTLTEAPGAERRRGRREELVKATEAAVDFYHERLKTGDDAGDARSYVRSRGYDGEVVGRFLIGYSPDSWDVLTRHLKARKFSEDTLLTAGLASRTRTGRLVDRFRGRVMFPIHDLRGDPVGFGARLLQGDGPKYLNSPETAIYHKSRLLYGLNWAKSDIVRTGEAVVVEGYTDVIGFALAGMPVAVATCGTALGEEHLDLLRRFTERVVLAFDADEAGAGAALRGFEKSVPGDLDLRVAALPPGRDPADLVFDGEIDALRKATSESIPLLQFRLEQELANYDLTEAEARGRAVTAAAGLVARHPSPVVRHEYAVLLSRRTGVDLDVVEDAVTRAARRAAGPPEEEAPVRRDRPLTGDEKAERELLRLLLANEPDLRSVELQAGMFEVAEHRAAYERLWPEIEALEPGRPPDLGRLIGDEAGHLGDLLRRLALEERPLADAGELALRLRLRGIERQIATLRAELEELDPDTDGQGYSETFAELIALERQRRDLRREL
jgi:DNA primase